MDNIEKELKYLLDKKTFYKFYKYLCINYKLVKSTRQINYYFDSYDFIMQKQHMSIRVRIKNNKGELTCKIPFKDKKIDSDYINCYEYNQSLSINEANYYIKHGITKQAVTMLINTHSFDNKINLQDLICHGHLRTTRIEFNIIDDIEPLLLDINLYLGMFDYELEWETTNIDKARIILLNLLSINEINPSEKVKTKLKRYLSRLKNS